MLGLVVGLGELNFAFMVIFVLEKFLEIGNFKISYMIACTPIILWHNGNQILGTIWRIRLIIRFCFNINWAMGNGWWARKSSWTRNRYNRWMAKYLNILGVETGILKLFSKSLIASSC